MKENHKMIDNEIYDFVYKRYCENCKMAFSSRIELAFQMTEIGNFGLKMRGRI